MMGTVTALFSGSGGGFDTAEASTCAHGVHSGGFPEIIIPTAGVFPEC